MKGRRREEYLMALLQARKDTQSNEKFIRRDYLTWIGTVSGLPLNAFVEGKWVKRQEADCDPETPTSEESRGKRLIIAGHRSRSPC